jgi:hypothetical protein
MRRIVHVPAQLVIVLIRGYQLTLGRVLAPRCRFHPTCSEYAIRSLAERGLIRGGALAAWRLARCGPWTAGGIDPVKTRSAAHV